MQKETFVNYFLNMPVSINNLYGDPFFPSQTENTFEKLDRLAADGHKGIVSIITKTEISDELADRLIPYTKSIKLIILVSISGLPYYVEKVKGNRFDTLRRCVERDIPTLAYLRPFIPPINTTPTAIEEMFFEISRAGVHTMVISGLRGNDAVLSNLGITEEEHYKWSMRVKIIPQDVRKSISEYEEKYKMTIFERTSCGVSYVLGIPESYNPYYASPQLAKCYKCPMGTSCFARQTDFMISAEDLELAKLLGYDAKIVNECSFDLCRVEPTKRTSCVSCCTSCFKVQRNAIEITPKEGEKLCLGDIGLLRLLIHKLVFCKNLYDTGDPTIAHPKNRFLDGLNLYMLNSWSSYSRNTSSCYMCSYCIVPSFQNQDKEYGDSPRHIAEQLIQRIEESGGHFDD